MPLSSDNMPTPTPKDRADAAARRVLRSHVTRLAQEEVAAREGIVEGVHQLRVATRRLRASLRLFAPVLPLREVARVTTELAWLAEAIGRVRDLDVLRLAVSKQGGCLDPDYWSHPVPTNSK